MKSTQKNQRQTNMLTSENSQQISLKSVLEIGSGFWGDVFYHRSTNSRDAQYPKGKPSSLTKRHGRFAGRYKSQLLRSMLLSDRRRGCWSFWQFGGAQEFLDSWYENTLSFKLPDAQQEKTDNYRKMSYFSVLLFRKHPSSVIRRIWSGSRSGALKTSGSIRNFDPEEF